MPLLLLPNSVNNTLAMVKRPGRTIQEIIKYMGFDILFSRLCVSLAPRTPEMTKKLIRAKLFSQFIIPRNKGDVDTVALPPHKHKPPASLSSIPAELRLKIFDYVTEGVTISVIGYRQGARDAFYFKQRGGFFGDLCTSTCLGESENPEFLNAC